ncbi:hypothetical protein F0562_024098 [Nyssa sinensis]|uniref:Homeobox domain-containing protein n=1 Tax=Nyssa sinensis TaxID=561372 RepID=A0A5J5BJT4_9ASTE|nr:hypothetical protein F0562_024098 [Nyssa sinensis]
MLIGNRLGEENLVFSVETYPSESLRADLSVKLRLSDRYLRMWFCHRRLKNRKALPVKRPRKDTSPAAAVASSSVAGDEMVVGEVGNEHAPCTINRPPSSPTVPHQRN